MVQHRYADVTFGQKLLSEGRVLWSKDLDHQLRESPAKALANLCDQLRPLRPEILTHLGPHLSKVAKPLAAKGQKKGVEVKSLPGQGRSLVATRHLDRGSVVIRESPLAIVDTKTAGLHPETRLALQLAGKQGEALTDLLDHGGKDPAAARMRAVIAACCADSAAAEPLFSWMGRVRVNAVAVTALVEERGQLEEAKVALALYPELARSVSPPQSLWKKKRLGDWQSHRFSRNHSCQPNGVLRFTKDGMVTHAMLNIRFQKQKNPS